MKLIQLRRTPGWEAFPKGATSWELVSAHLGSLLGFQKDNRVIFISFGSLLPITLFLPGVPSPSSSLHLSSW